MKTKHWMNNQIMLHKKLDSCTVVYTGFRGWGVQWAIGGWYSFTLEKPKISRFFKLETFQKCQKINENFFNSLKIFKEILRVLKICYYFIVIFHENLAKNLEKISSKINWNLQNIENFNESLVNFDWKKLILIKLKASLMES